MIKNSKLKIKSEDDLILCCARSFINENTINKIKMLVKEDLDWNYIIITSLKHRVIQFIYFQLNNICSEEVPPNILSILQDNYNEQTKYNLFLYGELFQILKLFESHGIKAVPYKGPTLAHLGYGNLSLRQLNHLNIIIKEEDSLKTREMLCFNGYELQFEHNSPKSYNSMHKYSFFRGKTKIPIHIRWNYLKNSFSSPYDLRNLWNFEHLKSMDIGINVFNPYPEDLLLIFCIQCAHNHWDLLVDIVDIAQLIQISGTLDWEEIFEKSRKLRLERILFINLFLANQLFGTEFPENVLERIKLDKSIYNISRHLIQSLFSKKDYLINKPNNKFYLPIRENRFDWYNDFRKSNTTQSPQVSMPFVKTPQNLIKKMLEFSEIEPEDVVYDLGCGDGRIVITAANEYGVKGVGIDVDTQRIIKSKENANKEGVEQLTTFFIQDIMEADLSEATLVTLYLTPALNIILKPKLQRELKPGTRVVSKDFDMGEWTPFKTDITFHDGHIVPFYLWKI